MIISGGMNVYSSRGRGELREHPAVADVGVVGVSGRDWGEAVVAVVVSRSSVDADGHFVLCARAPSAYKVPKQVVFVDLLPLTRYGKPDKKAMRAILSR